MKREQKTLWQEAFGDPEEAVEAFFGTAYDETRQETIYVNGQLGAALYWLDCTVEGQKIAYVYAVATAKAFRGRGLCRALMEKTHETLMENGYAGAVLVPQDEGLREMYGKMGYENFGGMEEIQAAAGEAVSLREISAQAYESLRRGYLPRGGVRQEGAALRYLGLYAKFYAGKDFLLVGAEENGIFRGMELLGDPQAAPGILAALGYAQGRFRVPGKEPFAMWHVLPGGIEPPSYFGLALD